jgi:hypothetical protein
VALLLDGYVFAMLAFSDGLAPSREAGSKHHPVNAHPGWRGRGGNIRGERLFLAVIPRNGFTCIPRISKRPRKGGFMTIRRTMFAALAASVLALSLGTATEAATVTLGFDDPVPAPLSLNADSPGIVNGNCVDASCLGVNSESPATLSTTDSSTFSVSSFWFQLLGNPRI